MQENISQQIINHLDQARRVLLITHPDPDGDGIPTTWEWKWGYEPLDLAHRLSLGASKKWGLQQTTSTIGLDRPA